MQVIGVTGSFGSGKSTVSGFFKQLGARVIDADKIAHRVIRRGGGVYKKIVSDYGDDILSKNKSIDRKRLGQKVFSSKKSLRKLCKLTHPAIITEIKRKLITLERKRYNGIVVIDAPLLIESGLERIVDLVLVVDADYSNQLKRSAVKDKITAAEIKKRIKSQMPLRSKKKTAGYIIDNNGTLFKTKKQVGKIVKQIRRQNG